MNKKEFLFFINGNVEWFINNYIKNNYYIKIVLSVI